MRRFLIVAAAAAALVLTAPVAHANEGGAPKADKAAQFVDITPVALPITTPDGRLVNYIFVQVRVNLTGSADAMKLREKEPFLRDALVRAAHRAPFTTKADYFHIDEARVKAAVYKDAGPILGQQNLVSVQVMSQQSKQRSGVPTPKT
jgi:hypothetical protein